MAGKESEMSSGELQEQSNSNSLKEEKHLNVPNMASRPSWALLKLIPLRYSGPGTEALASVLYIIYGTGLCTHGNTSPQMFMRHVSMPTFMPYFKMSRNTSCLSFQFPSVTLSGLGWLRDPAGFYFTCPQH